MKRTVATIAIIVMICCAAQPAPAQRITAGMRIFAGDLTSGDLPAAGRPRLACTASAPVLTVDWPNFRYVPMPFPLTVTVTNSGDALTDSVFATIIIAPDLTLAPGDSLRTKPLEKARLFPLQQGKVEWMLRHPPTPVEKSYAVKVLVWTSNADSTTCETTVIIPPLGAPILTPRDYMPDKLVFSEEEDSYLPNPFTVRLTCINTGDAPAFDVTGTLALPRYVELANPDDSLTKHFEPSTLEKWRIGDPVPELTWLVRWIPRLRYEYTMLFRSVVIGRTREGFLLDSVEVRGQTTVPGLLPSFACRMEIPDSLGLRADGDGVEPNPFTVRKIIWNHSHQTGSLTRVYITFPPDGLSLSPMSPCPTSFATDIALAPGDSVVFEWVIDVENRISRRNVLISVTAIDDEGNPMMCWDYLRIANLRTALSSRIETDVSILHYIPALNDYHPRKFVLTATLENTGGAVLHDLTAESKWNDPSGLDLIEADPEFPDPGNPKTLDVLLPGQSAEFMWGFRLRNENRSGISQYVSFNVECGSRETPLITDGDEVIVEIEPAGVTAAGGPPAAERCVLYPNHPNPFGAETTIRFALAAPASVSLVVTDVLGREQRRLLESEYRDAGAHAVRFDARDLRPGIYFYRLSAVETTLIGRMLLLR